MNHFIDTEFIEGFHKPLFGKRRHFIDLISIGVVSEEHDVYYAISNEVDYNDADEWVKKNVLDNIVHEWVMSHSGDMRNRAIDMIEGKGRAGAFKVMQRNIGKSNKQIAEELLRFFGCWRDTHFYRAPNGIEVYAYYADYDWVVFCSLFGRMIDLPKGFPMYCRDLKQMLDEKINKDDLIIEGIAIPNYKLYPKLEVVKRLTSYPRQENEHSALDDAKWNKKLYDFLKTI